MDAAAIGDPLRAVGRYELLFRIASGGMAEVYAARVRGEAGFQKLVAVKRMLPQLADDEEFVTMFLDEARVAANINSPHCVSTLDLGRAEDGSLYIVMELVVGVTLAKILRWSTKTRHPIPLGVAVDLLAQSAQGLHDAHEATTPVGSPLEIVHRDVSPQNVLVGVDGRVRLTDFGVARAVLRLTQTVAGRIKGKFAYCSPEQLMGMDVDRRSDIFALGVVAWEFFTGQRLFVGEHPMETMERVRTMPIPLVHQLRADVPPEISAVIARALSRDVEQRTPTAADFADDLRAAARAASAMTSRNDVSVFVRSAGGDSLNKIRENIKLALTNRPAMSNLPEAQEINLTPSQVSAVQPVQPADPDPTDPTTSAFEPSEPQPDASVPSAIAGPSSLLPAPAPPTDLSGQPYAPSKSKLPIALAAVGVLALLIGGVVLFSGTGEEPEIETVIVETAQEPPSVEPTEADPEPTVAIAEDSVTEGQATAESEEAAEEAAVEPPAAAVIRPRPTRPRPVTRMTSSTSAMMQQSATATEPVRPVPTQMRPAPGEPMSGRGMNGLLTIDAFDMSLSNMNR